MIQRVCGASRGVWNRFWFAPLPLPTMALLRIALGLYFTAIALISFPNWQRFYGPAGLSPFSYSWDMAGMWSSLFIWNGSEEWSWLLYQLFLFFSVCLCAGYRARLAAWMVFLIHGSMIRRNFYIVNGQDQVAQLLLFFACFMPLGSYCAWDARLVRAGDGPARYERWPLRLMQLSVALIYLSCGPTKFDSWKNGWAIYYVSMSTEWFRFPEVELFHSVLLSQLLTALTLAVECSFPFLVWVPRFRRWVVLVTAAFHLGIMMLLSPSVFYFNLIMIVGLLSFLRDDEAERALGPLRWLTGTRSTGRSVEQA